MKYTKTSTDVLHKVFNPDYSYIRFGGKEWICKTCDRALIDVGLIQLSFIPVCLPNTCNISVKLREGLHFSALHSYCITICIV